MLQTIVPEAYKIDFLDVPVPKVGNDQVLIKIKRVGICGSDIQVYHGKHKYMTFPIVQGHEVAGIITEVGKNIERFKIGDKVTVQPQNVCGKCYPCSIGRYNVCENLRVMGIHDPGMCVEYFLVNASKVLKLPNDMEFDTGALVEPTAVGVHAVKKIGEIKGSNVVVLGAGAIGNLTAQAAKALGANKVMITDIKDKRLDIAKNSDIDYCINTMKVDLGDAIKEHFGSKGADAIIDCAAVKATINQAIYNARRASKIIVVGNFKEKIEIEMPMLQRQEIDLIGVMMYIEEDFKDAINLLQENKIKTDGIITNYFDIRQFKEAYDYIDNHMDDVIKVMLKLED
ncbi:MAG: L-iditol 2-dehydrogenase [Clostridiales bacterium]|nr:L-iditol 2-dehydrogenase [Clostridiales bacterium]MDK2933944.1 L-iditol 2-dehydrogenase [Clostridiales bacterium]